MSVYYLLAEINGDTVIYTMDATENIEYTLPVQSTNYSVEDGSDVSDNIALRPRTVSFSGVISDVKTSNSTAYLSTQEYIKALEFLRLNKDLFTIYFAADLPPMDNVFFESLKISQDKTNGTMEVPEAETYGISSFKVSFTVKELRFSAKAKVGKRRADELNINKESDTSASTEISDSSKENKSYGRTAVDESKILFKKLR